MIDIMERFMRGEFGVRLDEQFANEFLEICEEHNLKWTGGADATDVPIKPYNGFCVDFGVHDSALAHVLFHESYRFYENEGYKLINFEEFMSEYQPDPRFSEEPVDLDALAAILSVQ